MYRSIQDFKTDFQNENVATLKILKNITNEALLHKANDNIRSIQRLTWHFTLTLGEMLGKAGLKINCPDEHTTPPDNIDTIYNTYKRAAESVLEQVSTWNDNDLNTEVPMYGDTWTKGIVLSVLIRHEIHHRGQLTVLMRLNGLKVPGIYGPSKEEWAEWNMPSAE